MWVLVLSYFAMLDTKFSPCSVVLKYPLVPANMADQDSIPWDYTNIIPNNNLGALDQLLLHLEGTNNIPKELYEFIGFDTKKSNTCVN